MRSGLLGGYGNIDVVSAFEAEAEDREEDGSNEPEESDREHDGAQLECEV